MAHALSMTDGTTTLTMTAANGYQVEIYTPSAPELNQVTLESAWVDGGEMTQADLRNVTETAELLIIGSSKTDLQSKINALEKMLLTARDRQQRRIGATVYVQLKVDGEAGTWRSEVLNGRLQLDEQVLNHWPNVKAIARLHITRRYFWEGAEATAASSVSLTNSSANVTTLSTITGVLPAPATVKIANNNGGTISWRRFFVCNDAFVGFTSTQHWITGSSTSWGSAITHANYLVYVSISDAVLAKCAGNRFHLIGIFNSITSGIYIKARLFSYFNSFYQPLKEGREIYTDASSRVIDFGEFQLPPGTDAATKSLRVVLSVYASGAGSFNLAALQLSPSRDLLNLAVTQIAFSAANGDALIWKEAEKRGYVEEPDAERVPGVEYRGGGLWVHPGRTNKVSLIFDEDAAYTSTRTAALTVTYRPRRLTI